MFPCPSYAQSVSSSLTPYYVGYYEWDGIQSSDDIDNGWIHMFGFSYDLPIPTLLPKLEEQTLSLGWDVTYNDGAFSSDPYWSHSTANLSATLTWKGLSFSPMVTYQRSFEDTVNDEDEFYASFSLSYGF